MFHVDGANPVAWSHQLQVRALPLYWLFSFSARCFMAHEMGTHYAFSGRHFAVSGRHCPATPHLIFFLFDFVRLYMTMNMSDRLTDLISVIMLSCSVQGTGCYCCCFATIWFSCQAGRSVPLA